MKKPFLFLIFILFFSLSLRAFDDYDLDGVEDIFDDCPNTLITDLVDMNGCTTESLQKSYNFDAIFGISYADTDYNNSQTSQSQLYTLQLDYYYKEFSFQLSTLEDIYLGIYYVLGSNDDLNLRIGVASVIPVATIEGTNKIDFMTNINLSYKFAFINLFAGYSHAIINDEASETTLTYQDRDSLNIGLGIYPTQKLYTSVAYGLSDAIYKENKSSQTLSFYSFYSLTQDWFTTLSYDHESNELFSSDAISIKIGYYF